MLWPFVLGMLGTALDQSYLEHLYARTVEDERSIDALIRRFNCSHVRRSASVLPWDQQP